MVTRKSSFFRTSCVGTSNSNLVDGIWMRGFVRSRSYICTQLRMSDEKKKVKTVEKIVIPVNK